MVKWKAKVHTLLKVAILIRYICKRKKHGKGIFTYENGDTYEGEFRFGNMEGQGIYKFANGNEYHGEWKDDKSHGKGKYVFKNGILILVIFQMGKKTVKECIRILLVKKI